MSNKLNPFEEQLKKAAENHSVPYDASQWSQLEKQLNVSAIGASTLFKWGWPAVAIAVVGLGTLAFLNPKSESQQKGMPIALIETQTNLDTDEKLKVTVEITSHEIKLTEQKAQIEPFVTESDSSIVSPQKPKSKFIEEEQKLVLNEVNSEEVAVEKNMEEKDLSVKETLKTVIPSILLSETEVCAGIAVQAELDSDEFEEVIWYLGDGSQINAKSVNHVFLNGGDYEVKAFLTKENVYTEALSVHVKPKPNAEFSVKNHIEREMIPVKYISVNEGGAATYAWNLGDRTILKGEGVSHTYRKKGTYEVSLRATNANGCSWTTFQNVEIEKDFNLLATNSFTPNGDGLNDTWYPLALTNNYYKYELKVYDRKGSSVFESNNPENKFDGRVNGQMVTPGSVFIWKAITIDPNGVQQEFGGNFIAYP